MYTVSIWRKGKGWTDIATIDGCEAAYNAFHKMCDFAEITGLTVCLYDSETGEVVADNEEEEDFEEDFDFDEADLEVGYNPYMGGYDWDC